MRSIKATSSADDIGPVTLGALALTVGGSPDRPAVPLHAVAPAPARNPELAHLDLSRLRTYRRSLLAEELRVSYWRRLMQARRDLLRGGVTGQDLTDLKTALTEARGATNRQVMLALHPEDGMPILPHLPALWASLAEPGTHAEQLARLASAESVLSSYREALHRRLDRATAELVARYHEDPALCLSALPGVRAAS